MCIGFLVMMTDAKLILIPNRYQDEAREAAFRKERLVSSQWYVVKTRSARNVLCAEHSTQQHKAFLAERIKLNLHATHKMVLADHNKLKSSYLGSGLV